MKESLLQYLACHSCGAEHFLNITEHDGVEIVSGVLLWGSCQSTFPIRSSVCRFADPERDEAQRATADNFSASNWFSMWKVAWAREMGDAGAAPTLQGVPRG